MGAPERSNIAFLQERPSGQHDPLIGAVVDKLPPSNTDWPAAARAAWLQMMENALAVVYGGPDGGGMTAGVHNGSAWRPAPRTPRTSVPASPRRSRPAKKKSKAKPPKASKAPPPPAEFYIDLQGHARNGAGETVLPEDINDVIYDRRGEHGDLGAIIWADGSRGIPKGMRLDISATPAG